MSSTSEQEMQRKLFFEMPSFEKTVAFSALKTLSLQPLDLTKEGVITPERIAKMKVQAADFTCLYGFEKVTDDVLKALFQLADQRKAIAQMQAMQSGEVVNFIQGVESENRPALHTAMRDIFDVPNPGKMATNARMLVKKEHEKLKKFIDEINAQKQYSDLILIGIGGSELGPKALYNALSFYQRKDRKAHFIGNVDPDDVALTLRDVELKKALVVVVSKSGTTLETATNEEFLRNEYVKQNLNPNEYFISITMPGTPMDDLKRYKASFHVWDYVGGRYSATSMVGGLLLSFAIGYTEFVELLKGAHAMDLVALKADPKENLPLLSALLGIWNRNFLGYPTEAIIPYAQVLHRFPAHLQQCDMESNGKRIDRRGEACSFETGPVIWGEPGTNAQHSFYQLIHQGTNIIPLELIGFIESQSGHDFIWKETTSQEKLLSNLFAQGMALAMGQKNANPNKVFPGNRPSLILLAKKLTPYALGALLSYYENKIAFQGFIWGINSFDQEGVQLGKVLAEKQLALFRAQHTGKKTDAPFPLGEMLLQIAKQI